MQELLRKTPHDSLAKWQIMTLVKYWKLDDCRLYKSETNAFLERVELVPELARGIALKTRRYIFIYIFGGGEAIYVVEMSQWVWQ